MACLFAAVLAGGEYDNIQVIRSDSEVNPDSFKIDLELDNGHIEKQEGHLQGQGEEQAIVQQGSFAWTAPDGTPVAIQYTADETGYHPVGDHLPTPPPIPEVILRSIEYINAHPAPQ